MVDAQVVLSQQQYMLFLNDAFFGFSKLCSWTPSIHSLLATYTSQKLCLVNFLQDDSDLHSCETLKHAGKTNLDKYMDWKPHQKFVHDHYRSRNMCLIRLYSIYTFSHPSVCHNSLLLLHIYTQATAVIHTCTDCLFTWLTIINYHAFIILGQLAKRAGILLN